MPCILVWVHVSTGNPKLVSMSNDYRFVRISLVPVNYIIISAAFINIIWESQATGYAYQMKAAQPESIIPCMNYTWQLCRHVNDWPVCVEGGGGGGLGLSLILITAVIAFSINYILKFNIITINKTVRIICHVTYTTQLMTLSTWMSMHFT